MAIILAKQAYLNYRAQGVRGLFRKLLSATVWKNALPRLFQFRERRTVLSGSYIKGNGIEIGALHKPLKLTSAASVKYVDRKDVTGLREHYPEFQNLPLVEIDLVDDGEVLSHVPNGSLDFIIANHFLEHCENPLGTIRQHLAKLKSAGKLFYALPDKRHTFDVKRALTSFEHLILDDEEGPHTSRADHYREWVEFVAGETNSSKIESRTRDLQAANYSIHFHVWDHDSFDSFLQKAREYLEDAFEIVDSKADGAEFIVVLQKVEE